MDLFLAVLFFAFSTTITPGPNNIMMLSSGVNYGVKASLPHFFGICFGFPLMVLLVGLGFGVVFERFPQLHIWIKVIGVLYLLWLAFKSGRSALQPHASTSSATPQAVDARSLYLRGLAMHLTNPKAVLSWLATVTVGIPAGASPHLAWVVVGGCMVMGVGIFGGYALAFSTPAARRVYARARRGLEGLLAAVFGMAGLQLLRTSTHAH